MAEYVIKSPEGRTYKITAPEGASQNDVLDYVKNHHENTKEQIAPGESKEVKPESTAHNIERNALETIENIPGSAVGVAESMAQPIIHPIDTATSLANLGRGVLQKTGVLSGTEYEKYPEAVGKFLADRYGSVGAAMKTLHDDPVGMAADLSMVFTGGGSAAARVPGIAGKVGEIAKTAGRIVDPINVAGKVTAPIAKAVGKGTAEFVGDLGTYTGAEPIKLAYQSGQEGGEKAKQFTANMRGTADMEDAVKEAQGAVNQIRKERGEQYRSGMKGIGADKTVLKFDDIDSAVSDIEKVSKYKDETISKSTGGIREAIKDKVDKWKALDPKEYHTPEGLDALKRSINEDIRKRIPQGPEHAADRKIANDAYNAVKDTIVKQAPEYAKVMKGYEEASDIIQEIEKTLSINKKASVDTQLRKLQSVLRNNVNANYGQRKELAKFLVDNGAPNLMEKLAGQALSSWAPRGMGRTTAGLEAALALFELSQGAPTNAAKMLPLLGASSPRVVGEAAHGAGVASRYADKVPARAIGGTAFQLGRESLLDTVQQALP